MLFARFRLVFLLLFCACLLPLQEARASEGSAPPAAFPLPLSAYQDAGLPLAERLAGRVRADPFNAAAAILFAGAILHTLLAGFFTKLAHRLETNHLARLRAERESADTPLEMDAPEPVSFRAVFFHYLGEVEAVFALWVIPLLLAALFFHGWRDARDFIGVDTDFREPLFVIVIMAVSASRPVVSFAERCLARAAWLFGRGSPAGWWLAVLLIAPVFGSLITEPAAMTIAAMLLARKFYALQPPPAFAYATLGLLFMNVSIGGVLTNFAAPPVLMVASKWGWSSAHMFLTFGWRALLAITVSTLACFLFFRRSLLAMRDPMAAGDSLSGVSRANPVPRAVTAAHLLFLAWTVLTSHYPPLCLGGFLFYLGFLRATDHHQTPLDLRAPVLTGFFLAGLVIHGRCQAWWLEPVMDSGLGEFQLLLGAAVLTGFNDNALITFLASQAPNLGENFKYAIMAGAVAGGGLTVIANAPNPGGQAILRKHFGGRVNPLALLAAALVPTIIAIISFTLGR